MASTFIPAKVIKHNNDVYLTSDLVIGVTQAIPTPGSGGEINGDYWAIPIEDNVVTGFNFEPTSSNSMVKPTPDSFHVARIMSRHNNDVWYVRGTTTYDGASPANAGYIQVAQDAETGATPQRTMPTDTPTLAPCQTLCNYDQNGKYFATAGLPALKGNLRYFPYGSLNGVALNAASSAGYSDAASLLSFLNSGAWGAAGAWTQENDKNGNPSGVIKLTQTSGSGSDSICFAIITVNPSA